MKYFQLGTLVFRYPYSYRDPLTRFTIRTDSLIHPLSFLITDNGTQVYWHLEMSLKYLPLVKVLFQILIDL